MGDPPKTSRNPLVGCPLSKYINIQTYIRRMSRNNVSIYMFQFPTDDAVPSYCRWQGRVERDGTSGMEGGGAPKS